MLFLAIDKPDVLAFILSWTGVVRIMECDTGARKTEARPQGSTFRSIQVVGLRILFYCP